MALQVLAATFTIVASSPASSQQCMMDERTQGAGPKDGKTLPMGPNTQWTLVRSLKAPTMCRAFF